MYSNTRTLMKRLLLSSRVRYSILCVFIHMHLISIVHAARPKTLSLVKYTNRIHPSPMQRVVVNNFTGEVYVSTRNALYQFSSDLKIKRIISTGPKLDDPECLHPGFPCEENRTVVDNDNKVLELFQTPNFSTLLTCGTLYKGLCQLHKLDDVGIGVSLKPYKGEFVHISGEELAVAVFAEGYDNQWSLYSARASTTYFSSLLLSKVMLREDFTLKHSYEVGEIYSREFFQYFGHNEANNKFIMGFSHGDFVYFLTTQTGLIKSSIETRLVRVCKYDPAFVSYTEIPLHCKYDQEDYNFATAAHFALEVQYTPKGKTFVNALFVSFMKHMLIKGGLVDERKGSVICPFQMQTLIEAFTNATRDCFKGESRRKPSSIYRTRFDDEQLFCTKMDDMEIHNSFCGTAHNPFIVGQVPLDGSYGTHLNRTVTSLTTIIKNGKLVVVAGTDMGDVIKVDMVRKREMFRKNIAADQVDKRIQSSSAFDSSHENLYLLVGNEVVMFPIGSCSVYTDCLSCLRSKDPINCCWCEDHCAKIVECEKPNSSTKKSCSPRIYDVKPLRGPTKGGTLITVTGDSFYNLYSPYYSMRINIANVPCKVISRNEQEVKCITMSARNHSMEGPVKITVKDQFYNSPFINGSAQTQENFTYATPLIYGVFPGKGPVSGGTNVTLFGYNLDIGYSRSIKVAGVPCEKIGIRNTSVWCVTGKATQDVLADVESSFRKAPVELQIDDAVIEIENQDAAGLDFDVALSKDFMYLPDPEIHSIHPQKTIVSGTNNLIVTGKGLDSVQSPKMIVSFTNMTGDVLEFMSDPCRFNGTVDGNTMICPTPQLKVSSFLAPTEHAPLITYVNFVMDAVEEVRRFSRYKPERSKLLYYPDPEFEVFGENGVIKRVTRDHTYLKVKGKYLNLVLTPSNIKVFFDNATICNVVFLSADSLSCEIPEVLTSNDLTNHSVTVLVGSLNFPLGQVEFIESNGKKIEVSIWYKISGVFVGIVAASSLVCLYYVYKHRKKRKADEYPLDTTIFRRDAEDANMNNTTIDRRGGGTNNDFQELYRGLIDRLNSAETSAPTAENCQSAATAHPYADDETMQLLQSQNVLLPRIYLSLGEVIGQGQFGCVYKGELLLPGKEEKLEVAVKTLLNSLSIGEQDAKAFLHEGLMMKEFDHQNVLSLIGVCFEGNGSPMVITPFMKHGDLLSYMRNRNINITINDLLMFGVHIAAGMRYLAAIKYVHRDLAARNCLLDDDKTVKIADFGLSRDIYERDYYSSDNKKIKIPIRWVAPESIENGKYTAKSDVWSYGVVLWELMTRGARPYPAVNNWDILEYLKVGRRLPQPPCCDDTVYYIMLQCWKWEPKARPTFDELEETMHMVIDFLRRNEQLELDVT